MIRQVTIRGRVQGVGYRAWVEHQAISRDLEGWVRNRRDGGVEAPFAGPADVGRGDASRHAGAAVDGRVDKVPQEDANSDALNLRQAGACSSCCLMI